MKGNLGKGLDKSSKCVIMLKLMLNKGDNKMQNPLLKETEAYVKVFRMQATGADGDTVRVSVPREVVEKEARRRGMDIKDFVKHFRVQWLFNGIEGAWARFIPVDKPTSNTEEIIIQK